MSRGFGRVRCSCHSPIPPVPPSAAAKRAGGGALRKIHFLAFDLPHSDGCFVAAYPAETTEAFCDGPTRRLPLRRRPPIHLYATPLAVARILGDGKRSERASSRSFSQRSVRGGSAGREGQRQGRQVEGLVGFMRGTSSVGVPRAESFAALKMLSPNSAAGARRRGCGASRRPSASVSRDRHSSVNGGAKLVHRGGVKLGHSAVGSLST